MTSLNIQEVLARLEESRAAEEENVLNCAEKLTNFMRAHEEVIDSESPIYDSYYQQGRDAAIRTLFASYGKYQAGPSRGSTKALIWSRKLHFH